MLTVEMFERIAENEKTRYIAHQKCVDIASKYYDVEEWKQGHNVSFEVAKRYGWEATFKPVRQFYPSEQWHKDQCIKDALKYNAKWEWAKASKTLHDRAKANMWKEECCAHMTDGYRVWDDYTCLVSAFQYNTKNAWKKGDRRGWEAAVRRGIKELCCLHMKPVQGKWTLETCKADALRFRTRNEWKMNNRGAHSAACKKKWLETCCAHISPPRSNTKVD